VALRDKDYYVRKAAAQGLGKLGDKGAVEPLTRALADMDGEVREAAAAALHTLGE
jgi:HEAT repeat protein